MKFEITITGWVRDKTSHTQIRGKTVETYTREVDDSDDDFSLLEKELSEKKIEWENKLEKVGVGSYPFVTTGIRLI